MLYRGLVALGPRGWLALGLEKYIGRDASGTEMYLGLPALSYRLVPRAGSPACPGLAALGPKKYIGRAASGTEMYLGLPALSYRVVPRAGSPMSPGLAALGPEKYIAHHPGSRIVKIFMPINVVYTKRTVWSVAFWGCVTYNLFMEGEKSYSIFNDF